MFHALLPASHTYVRYAYQMNSTWTQLAWWSPLVALKTAYCWSPRWCKTWWTHFGYIFGLNPETPSYFVAPIPNGSAYSHSRFQAEDAYHRANSLTSASVQFQTLGLQSIRKKKKKKPSPRLYFNVPSTRESVSSAPHEKTINVCLDA